MSRKYILAATGLAALGGAAAGRRAYQWGPARPSRFRGPDDSDRYLVTLHYGKGIAPTRWSEYGRAGNINAVESVDHAIRTGDAKRGTVERVLPGGEIKEVYSRSAKKGRSAKGGRDPMPYYTGWQRLNASTWRWVSAEGPEFMLRKPHSRKAWKVLVTTEPHLEEYARFTPIAHAKSRAGVIESARKWYYANVPGPGHGGQRSRKIWLAMQGLPNQGRADKVAARELEFYMDNDQQVARQIQSIRENLLRKVKSGKYDKTRSVKLWMYAVESGAKSYDKRFGSRGVPWHQVFPKSTREMVAREYAKNFDAALKGAGSWEALADEYGVRGKYGLKNRGRGANRRRTYKTLAGLKRAMGGGQLSLETIYNQRANIKGAGWTPIRVDSTDADVREIATMLGGRERTQNAVANGLRYGRIKNLPYSTRERIVWNKREGWHYIAGQDYRAETARIRKALAG